MNRRWDLFPETTALAATPSGEALTIAGCDLHALAERFGTPLYLYDAATLHAARKTYLRALAEFYPGDAGLTYAGKAFLCTAVAQWAARNGLWVDCTGEGELAIARVAGVPRAQILAHGVNKSVQDLAAAVAHAGVIVVDNLAELDRLAGLGRRRRGPFPDLWLRFRPGLAVDTHAYTQTGQQNSKFGLDEQEILQAALFCHQEGLPLTGLHFHQGSKFCDPAPLSAALARTLDLVHAIGLGPTWSLSPGGGWAVAYHEDDLPHPPIEHYVQTIAQSVLAGCEARGLALPHLRLEPGRSLIARAGVALYRVGAVKHSADRRWLLIDGGLADNPRPALYGARYSALPVRDPQRAPSGPAWLAGPYCESGDVLIEGLPLPDIEVGELVAVPVSGAYQLSMSSNYDGARRPAVLWLEDGTAHLIQIRESLQDLLRRDRPLPPPGGSR